MKDKHKDWIMKGYRYVYRPNHPSAHRGGLMDGRILEHRLIAEDMLGRPLEEDEVVHHIDRNRLNNDPANLMILTNEEHSVLHGALNRGEDIDEFKRAEFCTCKVCGKQLSMHKSSSNATDICVECLKNLNSAHIPSRETLIEELRGKSMEEVGRAHGVTGKAIKKWAVKRGIDIRGLTKPVGFTKEAIAASHTPEAHAKGAATLREYWKSHEHPSNKTVEQLDENGNVIAVFDSAVKAAMAFGGNDGSPVVRACLHDRTYKGFRFRYKT